MNALVTGYLAYSVGRSTYKSFWKDPHIYTQRSAIMPFHDKIRPALFIERLACIGVSPVVTYLHLASDIRALEVWSRGDDPSIYGLQDHVAFVADGKPYDSTFNFILGTRS